jgi:putative transposase
MTMRKKNAQKSKELKPEGKVIDYSSFEQQAMAALKEDPDKLMGKDGLLTTLYKQLLEKAMEGEIDHHMLYEEAEVKNRKNGKTKKMVRSSGGSFELHTPRDRNGTFSPEIVKKRQVFLGGEVEKKILSLYAFGMSYKDICNHVEEMYGVEVSPALISAVTDKLIPEVEQWQNRPLDECYPVIWMDAMHFKVREDGRVKSKAVYVILGINDQGIKEVLGLYISESEGARFWLQILTHLQNRGVKDIFIACIDNLKGFAEAIQGVYPQTEVQLCVIHQIRNSMKYVVWKDLKPFMEDLRKVYRASSESAALQGLDALEKTWAKKYAAVIKSWRTNWNALSSYFKYSEPIRKMMYTTNIIEGFNRQIRKVTKTKGNFTSEVALMKLLYVATKNIDKKWCAPIINWKLIAAQFAILFEGRFDLEKNLQCVTPRSPDY